MDEGEQQTSSCVTIVPEPSDGYGTHTTAILPPTPTRGQPPFRRIAVWSDALNWRTRHSQTGLHTGLKEQAFAEQRKLGVVVVTIQPSASEPVDSAQRA